MHRVGRPGLAWAGLAVVGSTYAIHLARPLQLEHDSVCYVMIAETAARGEGLTCAGCPRGRCPISYPPGYPALLAPLIRSGLAAPWPFVALNLGFLGLGCAATVGMVRRVFGFDRADAIALSAMGLLSYTVFKYVNAPLSDYAFFGVSATSLYVIVRASADVGRRRTAGLLAGSILAVWATSIRTIGIALFPAIIWASAGGAAAVPRVRAWIRARKRSHVAAGATAAALLALGAVTVLWRSDYVQGDLHRQYGSDIGGALLRTWGYRLFEWGQLVANAPAAKLPAMLGPVFPWVGAAGIGCALFAAWMRRRLIGPVDVFLLCYAAILAVWPYEDTRFWLPVIPLLVGGAAWAYRQLPDAGILRRLVLAYVSMFVLLGLGGQVYNARRSLAGARFPTLMTDDYLGPAYRAAWGLPQVADTVEIDTTVVAMIRRYDPRARRAASRTP